MTLSLHLFDTLPLWVSFLFYGLCMGAVWHWWKSATRGCLLVIIFWYAFFLAIVFWWASLSVQPSSIWIAFFLGACIPFARRMWEHETTQDTLYFFGRTWRFCVDMAERFEAWSRARREREARSQEEPPRQNTRCPHEGAGGTGQGSATDDAPKGSESQERCQQQPAPSSQQERQW